MLWSSLFRWSCQGWLERRLGASSYNPRAPSNRAPKSGIIITSPFCAMKKLRVQNSNPWRNKEEKGKGPNLMELKAQGMRSSGDRWLLLSRADACAKTQKSETERPARRQYGALYFRTIKVSSMTAPIPLNGTQKSSPLQWWSPGDCPHLLRAPSCSTAPVRPFY